MSCATLLPERWAGSLGLISAAKHACDTIEDETGSPISSNPISSNVFIARRRAPHCLRCTLKLQREESLIHVLVDGLDDLTPLLCTLRDRTGNIDTRRGSNTFASSAKPSGCDARDIVLASRISGDTGANRAAASLSAEKYRLIVSSGVSSRRKRVMARPQPVGAVLLCQAVRGGQKYEGEDPPSSAQ